MAAIGPPSALGSAASIPRLAFAVTDARRVEDTAAPTIGFDLQITSTDGRTIRSVLLDTQIQIAGRRRAYGPEEQERLFELFGRKEDWGTTLRTLLWVRQSTVVPAFSESTTVQLQVPCSYDLDVTASRYLDAVRGGDVPLEFLFSGSVFYAGAGGMLQAGRISWNEDAEYRLPVTVWRETMDHHFRGTAWLRLPKDSVDRLALFRSRCGHLTWEDAVEALLDRAEGQER